MNTIDRQIIDWFKSQFNDKDSIKNITYPIGYYIDSTIRDTEGNISKAEKMHNLLKAIRQDFTKILVTINRVEWINSLDNKELPLSSNELIPNTTKNDLIGTDIEYFFLKYRSIIDYSIDLLVNFYPNIKNNKKYNLEDKLEYLHDIFNDSIFINKNILSSKWFDQFRKIRNNIVHNGGTCVVFDNNSSQEILFQIYNTNLDELVIDDNYYKFNENVYYFNRFFIVYISYLYF